MKKLAIILMVSMLFTATGAQAFSLFGKDKDTTSQAVPDEVAEPAADVAKTDAAPAPAAVEEKANTEAAAAPAPAPATPEAAPAPAVDPDAGKPKVKEADPVLKEVMELQQNYFQEMRENETKYNEKRAKLMAEYRKKIEDENPKKLQEYIKQCETQAIERYAMENNMEMNMMPGMMPR